jgi:hypothetical protein
MLITGFFSMCFIAIVYLFYCRDGNPILKPLIISIVAAIFGLYGNSLVFFFVALFAIAGLLHWKKLKWPAWSFLAYMILAATIPFGSYTYQALGEVAEQNRLRQAYAFESMEGRVPEPKIHAASRSSDETQKHMKKLEANISNQANDFRILMLERLHNESVRNFIDSPGFGFGRRIGPSESTLNVNLRRNEVPIRQPGPISYLTVAENDLREINDLKLDPLREMHVESVLDFAYPEGFGWFLSRQKVAGFLPHRFSMVPKAPQWHVQSVELVGLIMHDGPVVYVSDELPRMEKLGKVLNRSLNAFETVGLKRLLDGEDLCVRETNDSILMLGAVRSIRQCVKCHGGERGDLLGAFSYSLTRYLR